MRRQSAPRERVGEPEGAMRTPTGRGLGVQDPPLLTCRARLHARLAFAAAFAARFSAPVDACQLLLRVGQPHERIRHALLDRLLEAACSVIEHVARALR